LEAVKAREGRKAERELRRQDVERLLTHFKQQRQESSRTGGGRTTTIQKEDSDGNRR